MEREVKEWRYILSGEKTLEGIAQRILDDLIHYQKERKRNGISVPSKYYDQDVRQLVNAIRSLVEG